MRRGRAAAEGPIRGPLRVRALDSLDGLDPGRWDALTRGKLTLSRDWLRAMEEAHAASPRPLYVLVEDDAGPLAAFVVPYRDSVRNIESLASPGLARALAEWTLFVTLPGSSGAGPLALRRGLPRRELLRAIVPVFDELCRVHRRSAFVINNASPRDLPAMRAAGFLVYRMLPGARLRLPKTYQAYLQSLRSQDRRELTRIRRRAERNGTTFSVSEGVGGRDAELFPLLKARYERHGVEGKDVGYRPDILSRLERRLPGRLTLFEARVQGRLAGFMVGAREGRSVELMLGGYDYPLARPNFVYFLLYDEAVRWAFANGVRRLEAGPTTLDVKKRLGFKPVPQWACWRPRRRALRPLCAGLQAPIHGAFTALWSRLER